MALLANVTDTTMEFARRIKQDVERGLNADHNEEGATVNLAHILSNPPTSHTVMCTFESRAIFKEATDEYTKWVTPPPVVDVSCDFEQKLVEWVRNIPLEDLKSLLDDTPSGLAADPNTGVAIHFTPWQRLSMAHWVHTPFLIRSKAQVTIETLRDLAQYPQQRYPKHDLVSDYSLMPGTTRDVTINNYTTGKGKTSWACAIAYMALSNNHFPYLVEEYHNKQRGVVIAGPPEMHVARLAIFAVPPSTFDHFVTTLRRLVPMVPGEENIQIWTKIGKSASVKIALDASPNTITFWVVPTKRLRDVLCEHPHIAVALCVTDEFTVDVPRQRLTLTFSPTLKQVILNATPSALVTATSGQRTWLKDFLGGTLLAPSCIGHTIRRSDFKNTVLAMRQMCMLDLMTLTPYRERVHADMHSLVPSSLAVHFVRSRVVTMAAHVMRARTDMVPASLINVLANSVSEFRPTRESLDALTACVNDAPTPETLMSALNSMESQFGADARRVVLERVVARIEEFTAQCPLCWGGDGHLSNMRMCPKCGYCVCNECFGTCGSRCAFCRNPIQSQVPRVIPVDPPPPPENAHPEPVDVGFGATLEQSFLRRTSSNKSQSDNLSQVLCCLKHHGFKRTLLVFEKPRFFHREQDFYDVQMVAEETGVVITRIDTMLRGKGTEFARLMRERFNTPNPQAMALLSVGMEPSFLVGTDLAFADSMISVGDIEDTLLTQAVGRIMRPRTGRDNTRPIVMVKIYARRLRG